MVTNVMDHGVSAMAATTVLSVAGLASLGGKIVCGLIADRGGSQAHRSWSAWPSRPSR
jgi:hypothetical protein